MPLFSAYGFDLGLCLALRYGATLYLEDEMSPKRIAKLIRDEGPKGVRTQVQGDELRVFSKKRDDLQACQRLIQAADYDFAVQFANYR